MTGMDPSRAMQGEQVADGSKALLLGGSLLVATLIAFFFLHWSRSKKNLPPVVPTIPVVGGLMKFIKGPMIMLQEQYERLGSVFTVKVVTRNITFLIGPEVSSHFFKAQEADLSQREVLGAIRVGCRIILAGISN